jgi:hypothetical protein
MYVCTQKTKDGKDKAAEMLKKASIADPDDKLVIDLASGLRAYQISAATTVEDFKGMFLDEQP